MSLLRFIGLDFWRNLRNFGNTFFMVGLPTALYLFFGVNNDWASETVGNGNVSAVVMIGMASFGAAMAMTSLAGVAAVEQQQGWGRQLGLTSLTNTGFFVTKVTIAVGMSAVAIAVLYLVGALTAADMTAKAWAGSFVLTLVGALPFSLYGLAVGMGIRSDAAVSVASGLMTVWGFLGNAFVPLSGVLLDIARFTPMYGSVSLARYPVVEGYSSTADGVVYNDPMWAILANVAAWTTIFGVACWLLAARTTRRA